MPRWNYQARRGGINLFTTQFNLPVVMKIRQPLAQIKDSTQIWISNCRGGTGSDPGGFLTHPCLVRSINRSLLSWEAYKRFVFKPQSQAPANSLITWLTSNPSRSESEIVALLGGGL